MPGCHLNPDETDSHYELHRKMLSMENGIPKLACTIFDIQKKMKVARLLWHSLLFLAGGRQTQVGLSKVEAYLIYKASFRIVSDTQRNSVSKTRKKNKQKRKGNLNNEE